MAQSNLGGCAPVSPPVGGSLEPIRADISDLLRLGPEDYRAVAIPMWATIGPTTSGYVGSNTYRVPTSHKLVIQQIFGHFAMSDVLSEVKNNVNGSDATKGLGDFSASPDVMGRVAMKAMNARLLLQNTDRSQPVFEGGLQLNLASILTMIGGEPLDFSRRPFIVVPGESLKLDVSLVQTDGKVVGGSSEYGVMLVGLLIRAKTT